MSWGLSWTLSLRERDSGPLRSDEDFADSTHCCDGRGQEDDGRGQEDKEGPKEWLNEMPIRPRFALVPLTKGAIDRSQLNALIASMEGQSYDQWRLYLSSEDGFEHHDPRVEASLAGASAPENIVSAASIDFADFVIPVSLGARLAPHALSAFVRAINEHPDAELLFGAEDLRCGARRFASSYRIDWDPFFILGRNFVAAPACFRRQGLRRLSGPFRSANVDNLLHELTLRFVALPRRRSIVHIPMALCERTSVSDWSGEEGRVVVEDFLRDAGQAYVKVEPAPHAPEWSRIQWPLPEPEPFVSIIIPTRDKAQLLRGCSEGLLKRTEYRNLELVIVDNGTRESSAIDVLKDLARDSRVRIVRDDRPFNFSRLVNQTASLARGELLLLLNNDTKVLHSDWLRELVSLAVLPQVGVVGAKLLYPNMRVQHAGIGFGPNNLVWHMFQSAASEDPGQCGELALTRQVSAVTGACLMVRRDLFNRAGGLDEALAIAYQDVDFCRKVARLGYSIVWTPFAQLLHFEAATRGNSESGCANLAREYEEMIRFWELNPEFYGQPDPCLTPNATCEDAAVLGEEPFLIHSWDHPKSAPSRAGQFYY